MSFRSWCANEGWLHKHRLGFRQQQVCSTVCLAQTMVILLVSKRIGVKLFFSGYSSVICADLCISLSPIVLCMKSLMAMRVCRKTSWGNLKMFVCLLVCYFTWEYTTQATLYWTDDFFFFWLSSLLTVPTSVSGRLMHRKLCRENLNYEI